MERQIKCSCGRDELPVHTFKEGWFYVECGFCGKQTTGMAYPELAREAWNDMMREEYSKPVEKHAKDELYAQEFKTKEHKELLCNTCKHHDRKESLCKMHYKCWQARVDVGCDGYESYYPSREDIDEALKDADKPKQVGGDHYSRHKFQVWDIVDEYQLSFYEGNILKYLLRRKGDRGEDLKKARSYIDRMLEGLK